MPFNFNLDDVLDFDDEDDSGLPSDKALGSVLREQGPAMKTSASGFGYANQQVSVTNMGSLMLGIPLYKDASVATNQEEFILSNLLGSSLTVSENEDKQVGYGFDEYVPSDIKAEAAVIGPVAAGAAAGSGGTGGGAAAPGTPIAGVEFPPNLGAPDAKGLYTMPDPQPPGTYVFSVPGSPDHKGARELVGVIYTVGKKWHETYSDSSLRVGDLNAASGHVSHKKGVDVDITVSDASAANTGSHNRDKSIQLGKWFIDTGIIKLILFNDTATQEAVNAYAQAQGKPGIMKYWDGHNDHFHVRILDDYIIV